jgi:hypothetical protein
MTTTERRAELEAELQAALRRAALHQPEPGDFRKLQPALAAAWKLDHPDAWERMRASLLQNPRIAAQIAPGSTQQGCEQSECQQPPSEAHSAEMDRK